jgi:thioredoxin-dependent peroxiredoxin
LRKDHSSFEALGARILAIAPDDLVSTQKFLESNPLPYPLLPDSDHAVFDRYDVANKLVSLGQRPGLFVIDAEGIVRYNQVGVQQWQIPPNEEILGVLRQLGG